MQSGCHFRQFLRRSGCINFNASIRQIACPSGKPQFDGALLHKETESNALHSTAHQPSPGLFISHENHFSTQRLFFRPAFVLLTFYVNLSVSYRNSIRRAICPNRPIYYSEPWTY